MLVGSGLQIFNASPNLDASDKSDPARRVLAIGSPADGVGTTTIFGRTFVTTGWLGWTSDGMGSRGPRAFGASIDDSRDIKTSPAAAGGISSLRGSPRSVGWRG